MPTQDIRSTIDSPVIAAGILSSLEACTGRTADHIVIPVEPLDDIALPTATERARLCTQGRRPPETVSAHA